MPSQQWLHISQNILFWRALYAEIGPGGEIGRELGDSTNWDLLTGKKSQDFSGDGLHVEEKYDASLRPIEEISH